VEAVKPDLPTLDNGTPGAIFAWPASPKKIYSEAPGSGGDVTILKMIDGGQPIPLNKNKYWQELNKRVNANLKMNNIVYTDYPAKLATTLAGGDIPDLVQMRTDVAHLPDILAKEFADLSDYLAGDGVKNYPGLANNPQLTWSNTAFNGGLWGAPTWLGLPGSVLEIRQDILDDMGLSATLTKGDDFINLCKQLTDAKKGRWAIGSPSTAINIVREMVGAPNNWKEVDGKFTSTYETDEYKQGLGIIASLWKNGYIEPDSMQSTASISDWFASGKVCMSAGGYTNWGAWMGANTQDNPKFNMNGLVPPKWDGGGQAAHWIGNGMYTFTAVKKASKDRVAEMVRILDWFSAPFASEEWTFQHNGIPGVDYTLKGTDPVTTGNGEVGPLEVAYISLGPLLLYTPAQQDATKAEYNFLSNLMKVTVADPTVGLFSDTDLTKGATIGTNITAAQNDIIAGRKPLDSWDDAVKAWRSGGGDQIRKEFEESFAKSGRS
jgi:putative aldouronate transport system substrate-binding protein